MSQKRLRIQAATIEDTHFFAVIKAKTYSDDRERTRPLQPPKWYDGEWYVGLGVEDDTEAKRLIKDAYCNCYMILLDEAQVGIVWLHQEEQDSYTLEDFCILPEYQGYGYGQEALLLIEQLYPDNHRWMLTTPSFCERNRHLYEKMGYRNIGTCSEGTVIQYQKETQ